MEAPESNIVVRPTPQTSAGRNISFSNRCFENCSSLFCLASVFSIRMKIQKLRLISLYYTMKSVRAQGHNPFQPIIETAKQKTLCQTDKAYLVAPIGFEPMTLRV